MSFGFGVGDFIAVGTLAARLYAAYRDAPAEYSAIAQDLMSLHITLEQLSHDLSDQKITFSEKHDSLVQLVTNCHDVLRELDDIHEKYLALATERRFNWRRLRLRGEDIDGIRGRLMVHLGGIQVVMTSGRQ